MIGRKPEPTTFQRYGGASSKRAARRSIAISRSSWRVFSTIRRLMQRAFDLRDALIDTLQLRPLP
jgi:hypothetical protein